MDVRARLRILRAVAGPFVSVVRQDGFWTPTARIRARWSIPSSGTADTRKRIRPSVLFNENADNGPTLTALAKLVQAALVADREEQRDIPFDPDPAKVHVGAGDQASLGQDRRDTRWPRQPRPNKSSGLTFHYLAAMVGPSCRR